MKSAFFLYRNVIRRGWAISRFLSVKDGILLHRLVNSKSIPKTFFVVICILPIPDLVDRIHQHIQAFRNGCINKEQSVPCIYKITSCPGLPCHIPCTGSYLKRLNSQDPGPVSQSGHRILDCRSTTKRHNKTLLYLNLFPF